MSKQHRILILEDHPADAELAERELRRAGLVFVSRRAETKQQFLEELNDFDPDLIISDYTLPQFTGLDAVRLLKDQNIDAPFILCTGSLTEEVAVECMREGAADYILKSSLTRLPSAVTNALLSAEERRAKEAALAALRESEENFRSIVETTHEWIWAADVTGRITYSNPAVKLILGLSPEEMIGRTVFDFIHHEDRQILAKLVRESCEQQRGWSQTVNRFRDVNGNIRFLESNAVPVFGADGGVVGFRGSDRDITHRRLAEEQLLHDAFHDGLTGLANRKLFMEHLQLTIERGKSRHSNAYAVLFLDFDRFKVINDSLGHAQGDALLRLIARRLEACTRTGDLIARLGGDEFVILLSELAEINEALLVADRILDALKNAFVLGERPVFITASIGVALSTSKHRHAEDMVRDADIAMYCAKERGRAQFQIFDAAMHARASQRLSIETELRQALLHRQFCLHFQPIIHLATGSLAGFESLIRWQHPNRGMIPPDEFIPVAEETGLILELGQWTVEESCRLLREWQDAFPPALGLTVSVNLSSKEFHQVDLADQIASAIRSAQLSPECLKLEITESHVMENSELAVSIVNRLRGLGVEFSLDDFGTGYSSLAYLHRLPFSYLKVDRSFVNLMTQSTENYEIVRTVVTLARNLRMKIIAEGIETADHFALLKQLQCDFGQGYLFSRPLDAHAAKEYLERSWTVAAGPHREMQLPLGSDRQGEHQLG